MTGKRMEIETRREKIIEMKKADHTYNSIGRELGISGERVRQIVNNTRKKSMTSENRASLTTQDVANLLNIHPNTVRRWANNGTLKAYRIGSRGDRRFKRKDIDGIQI